MNAQFQVQLGGRDVAYGKPNPTGQFIDRDGERFYVIRNVDQMRPFFTSIVSASDHWLFASSNGGLTCGRRNSQLALFPYVTEDKVRDNVHNTGPYTALLVGSGTTRSLWEPLRADAQPVDSYERHLYKSVVGDRLIFEEVNHSLGLRFSAEWCTSDRFGFVRRTELSNVGAASVRVELLDGVRNLLPACVDEQMQLGFSCLLDAYKENEAHARGLATFSLASQIVDRAEPREALRATSAFSVGLSGAKVLVSEEQLHTFRQGFEVEAESSVRGRRGAYFLSAPLELEAGETKRFSMALDVNRTQADVAHLLELLREPDTLAQTLDEDVALGAQELRALVMDTDGQQFTADEASCVHHFANTLFNDMRGGVYANGYTLERVEVARFVRSANLQVWERNRGFLEELPDRFSRRTLLERVEGRKDPNLERLCLEYLPLTFSRRHGDPSRPWNKFDIKVRDAKGAQLLGFQGNWRDIFQNWEALSASYPEYIESIIAKFVNASTVDGYNPYRITDGGIDWEVPEPDNPWAGIGYWGDHQIVYLLKLLEQSRAHHPERLSALLKRNIFTYANVPYRIKGYESLRRDAQDTIEFDHQRHELAMSRAASLGFDGKLVMNEAGGEPYRVNLIEKLLVASLAKMGNYVPGAGIWLNTQRPEWNDANNALVGSGVSMVTLYYLARYFHYLDDLLAPLRGEEIEVSQEVADWLSETLEILAGSTIPDEAATSDTQRRELVDALGALASTYRSQAYGGLSRKVFVSGQRLYQYVAQCRRHLQHTMTQGRRADGLYHAYNLLRFEGESALSVEHLYPMLEGQVAALSAGVLTPGEVIELLRALRDSEMYRPDQQSYMLYPDRTLPGFLQKNQISEDALRGSALLTRSLERGDGIVVRDDTGTLRFSPEFYNQKLLEERLREGSGVGEKELKEALDVYEGVFNHHAFTGRSGTMFGYEGLGSIYWHMVAKLLLVVQENFLWAEERGATKEQLSELRSLYYEIRQGVGGFNKTPEEYGAFPMDPYSHTPERSGARQPGMTGQVKEEILTRLGELGVRVNQGRVSFSPTLLRSSELLEEAKQVMLLRGKEERRLDLPKDSLAFSYCGVPVVVHRSSSARIAWQFENGAQGEALGNELPSEISRALFERDGKVARLDVFAAL